MRKWSNEEIELLTKYYPIEGSRVYKMFNDCSRKECNEIIDKLRLKDLDRKYKPFTDEEVAILRKYYPIEGVVALLRIKEHSIQSSFTKVHSLGLTTNEYKPWVEEDVDILRKYYPTEGANCYKRFKNRGYIEVMSAASRFNIRVNKDVKIPKKKRTNFTNEEIEIIKKYYPTEGNKISVRLPNHSISSIVRRASSMGIHVVKNTWTDEEINTLEKYYPIEGADSFKRIPNKSIKECIIKVRKFKVGSRKWTDEEIVILEKYYPTEGSNVIKRLPNRNRVSIQKVANRRGIHYIK